MTYFPNWADSLLAFTGEALWRIGQMLRQYLGYKRLPTFVLRRLTWSLVSGNL